MTPIEASKLLSAAGLFYVNDPKDMEPDESPELMQTLNMNDTWAWGTAWGEYVPDDELPTVAKLFFDYGFCGVLYWMHLRHDRMWSEYQYINRMIQFVEFEESIRRRHGGVNSKYAYDKQTYIITGTYNGKETQ